jgi:DNA (cytosine-5)-methyltransferase 1
VILDLFAGTGWGVACQQLGLAEIGVDNMPEVIATRTANGMVTAFEDVWDGLTGAARVPWYQGLIASPPCQTFSVAGKGAGRQALDEVLRLIAERAYLRVEDLRAFGDRHDDRTALVLTPLAYVAKHRPQWVLLEQVPAVLPVWEACGDEMRGMGYSVWTGVLNAEQYGVPQTRRRAVLIAHADRDVAPPTPTHSRYYSREPKRLDPGVLPWVSMAEALGWAENATVRSAQSVASEGRAERPGGVPGFTVTQTTSRVMRSNYGTGGDPAARGERAMDQPSATVTSKVDRNMWSRPTGEPIQLDPSRPATTVAGDPRLSSRQHHYHGEQNSTSTRVTIDEAALLQSFPPGFTFEGGKGRQFLQVGNAIPPLLARALIESVVS